METDNIDINKKLKGGMKNSNSSENLSEESNKTQKETKITEIPQLNLPIPNPDDKACILKVCQFIFLKDNFRPTRLLLLPSSFIFLFFLLSSFFLLISYFFLSCTGNFVFFLELKYHYFWLILGNSSPKHNQWTL